MVPAMVGARGTISTPPNPVSAPEYIFYVRVLDNINDGVVIHMMIPKNILVLLPPALAVEH